MADYYSIKEVTEILGKSEAEIRTLVHDGKIREFYDNGTKMFKKEEVDSLKVDLTPLSLELDNDEPDDIPLSLDDTSNSSSSDESSIIGLASLDDTAENKKPETKVEFSLEESSLDNEMSSMIELSEADTNFGQASNGINVLEDSNDEFGSLEDSMADTKESDALDADDTDALDDDGDLGRLDADVNLDSFGSGSGLLDLSLQADDTSLGAVLDDILPSAGGEEAGIGEMDELGLADSDTSIENDSEEADPQKSNSNLISGMLDASNSDSFTAPAPSSSVATVVEVPVDPASSAYGSILFVPLVALLILAVSVFAAIRDIMPSIVKVIANYNLYITIALVLFTVIAGVVAIVMGQPKTAKPKKVKKAKKAKKKK